MDMLSRTLSIAETAEATGLSKKAVTRRIERETLQSVLRDGQRRVPTSELIRAGLIGIDGAPGGEGNGDATGIGTDRGIPGETFNGLLDRLERLLSLPGAEIRECGSIALNASSALPCARSTSAWVKTPIGKPGVNSRSRRV